MWACCVRAADLFGFGMPRLHAYVACPCCICIVCRAAAAALAALAELLWHAACYAAVERSIAVWLACCKFGASAAIHMCELHALQAGDLLRVALLQTAPCFEVAGLVLLLLLLLGVLAMGITARWGLRSAATLVASRRRFLVLLLGCACCEHACRMVLMATPFIADLNCCKCCPGRHCQAVRLQAAACKALCSGVEVGTVVQPYTCARHCVRG